MCNQCNILKMKKDSDTLLDNDKWVIFKTGLVVSKEHGVRPCENCLLWIRLKCRQLFGKKCKYDYKQCEEHFYFNVIGG